MMKDEKIVSLKRSIKGHDSYVYRLNWSPNGQFLVTPSADNQASVWRISDGKKIQSISTHTREVNSAVWSSCGNFIATCGDDFKIFVSSLDVKVKPIEIFLHTDEVNDLAWHPNKDILVSVSDDKKLILHDITDKDYITSSILRGHTQTIWSVEWSPNGEWIATGSDDQTVRLWRYNQDEIRTLKSHNSTVRCVKWFSDSERLVSADRDGNLIFWSIHSPDEPKIVNAHSSIITSISISYDEKIIASRGNDGFIRFWDTNQFKLIGDIPDSFCERWSIGIAFSPIDNKFASLTNDFKSIRIWDFDHSKGKYMQSKYNNSIFISYSHKDRIWLDRLVTMLEPLLRNYSFSVWSDIDIDVGEKWRQEIQNNLESCDIAIMLVSPDFLASKFIMEIELPYILKNVQNENTLILWIPIRHALFEESGLIEFQAVTNPNKPLASIKKSDADKVLTEVCRSISKLTER